MARGTEKYCFYFQCEPITRVKWKSNQLRCKYHRVQMSYQISTHLFCDGVLMLVLGGVMHCGKGNLDRRSQKLYLIKTDMMIDFDRGKSLPSQKRRQQKHRAFIINMSGGTKIRTKMQACEGQFLPLFLQFCHRSPPQGCHLVCIK